MITAEIKLYEEPKPTYIGQTSNYTRQYAPHDLRIAVDDAIKLGISPGARFKYKASGYIIKVKAFQTDYKKLYNISGSPSILLCERYDTNNNLIGHTETPFSVNEVLSDHMEFI